ncbi:hypothetical protein ACK31Z_22130 [Aeromonas dhakensis]|uniref:hypothetical protein n=1 Tax=Aeromonas dhakensis TaxID=196024 RepID=UPI00244AF401|nr:hypothetical protein [Aeromonas dhakensis]MDH0177302.1 hypothetical protein [Aeromonas dhakensis]
MEKYFDGSSFTMMESADERSNVVNEFKKNTCSHVIRDTYNLYPKWWAKTRQVFNSCFDLARDNGQATLVILCREKADFSQYHYLFLSNPVSMKSFGIWAMYQSLQNAELKLIEQCKTPRTEVSLTGKLTANIDHCASIIQKKYEKHLCLDGTHINLGEIELQVQNREKITGADFALLLEWKCDNNALIICPIYFQAKRVTEVEADISQHNENVGYQFHVLQSKKLNSAYIFYNCSTQETNATPRVPAVKNIKDIVVDGDPKKTSSVDNVLSLSTFLLDVIVNTPNYITFNDRASALRSILSNIQENELASVFSLSVDEDAKLRYQEVYNQYVIYKKGLEKSRNNDSGSSFGP